MLEIIFSMFMHVLSSQLIKWSLWRWERFAFMFIEASNVSFRLHNERTSSLWDIGSSTRHISENLIEQFENLTLSMHSKWVSKKSLSFESTLEILLSVTFLYLRRDCKTAASSKFDSIKFKFSFRINRVDCSVIDLNFLHTIITFNSSRPNSWSKIDSHTSGNIFSANVLSLTDSISSVCFLFYSGSHSSKVAASQRCVN